MLSGSIDSIDIDINALTRDELSPAARSAALAEFARETLADAETQNTASLEFTPDHTTTVDGAVNADEDRVQPDGTIEYSFDILPDIFSWIASLLRQFAPVRSGRFRDSFQLYADGAVIDPDGVIPQAALYVFESIVAYASKIEGENKAPESKQAPNGVFEAVAAMAQQRFAGQANISFGYLEPVAGESTHETPAITITTGNVNGG